MTQNKNTPPDEEQQQVPYNGKFKIKIEDLVKIASAGQERNFSEEVDILEQLGGEQWLEREMHTDFTQGLKCAKVLREKSEFETQEQYERTKFTAGDLEDQEERELIFKSNRKPEIPPKGFCTILIESLDDFILKVLIGASFGSMILSTIAAKEHERSHAWIEGFAILIAVAICSLVTTVNDWQKEKQFQVLNKVADDRKTVTVIRNGEECIIHQDLVMTGDIIKLQEGMEIPADGIVIRASELTTDESAMTGETDPIKKNTIDLCIHERDKIIAENSKNTAGKHDVPSPLIMSGTKTLTGEGVMVVIVVGDDSCLGKIAAILRQKDEEQTPLQQKLTVIAEDIGKFGLYSAIAIVSVMMIRFIIERVYEEEFGTEHLVEILSFFIIGITVIVVAIPEGLPLAVTLSLAFSIKKMLKDQNLVRKLQACETMGGANNICSDKTGTLTKNEMTLVQWWNVETVEFPDIANYNLEQYMGSQFIDLFLQSTAVNSSAMLHPEEKGSKTETAVLKFLMKTKYDYRDIRKQYEEIQKFPFSSARKRMSIIINVDGKQRLLVKGASEMVLASCTKWINKNTGQVEDINPQKLEEIKQGILGMANNALRTICLAYKDLNGNEDLETKDKLGVFDVETKDLTMVAIFGIADIIRPEVPIAVSQCFNAGIKVRMVTGDNKDTARAIALKCGIIKPERQDDLVIEGPEFIRLTGGVVCKKCRVFTCDCPRDKETAKIQKKKIRVDTIKDGDAFDKIYPNLCVMARSRPEDKYALVTGLIERGNVVAVTGDGTNDAPALKKADVGFSMGIAGTSVARDASDIILLDDNFNSIVKAVLWGRNIYDSIKKFLQFQLTVNLVSVTGTLVGAATIKQEIFSPIQMLWLNLIMDTFASLALATEPPNLRLLNRAPQSRAEYMVTKKMSKHIIFMSIYQLFLTLFVTYAGHAFLPEWENKEFKDDLDNKIKDYIDNLDGDDKYNDESLRYYYRYPYKYMFQTEDEDYMVSGIFKDYSGFHREYENIYDLFQVSSRHMTFVFNLFVMMQVFNFLNCRKIRDEVNIFEGLTRNLYFPIILGIIIAFQSIVVTFGGKTFHCFGYYGLNIEQWLICIGFGLTVLVVDIFIKFIPEEKMFSCAIYDHAEGDEEANNDDLDVENNQDEGPLLNNQREQPIQSQEQNSPQKPQQKVSAAEPAQQSTKGDNSNVQPPQQQQQIQPQPQQEQENQYVKPQQDDAPPPAQQENYTNPDNNNNNGPAQTSQFDENQVEQIINNDSQAKNAPEDDINGQQDEEQVYQEQQ